MKGFEELARLVFAAIVDRSSNSSQPLFYSKLDLVLERGISVIYVVRPR